MRASFGPVRQLGFVVPDINVSLRHWIEDLRIGPFFVIPDVEIRAHEYRRAHHDRGPRGIVALAQSGDIQIELIQTVDDRPSVWRDFVERTGGGLHHVSSWLTRREYDRALETLAREHIPTVQRGVFGPDVRFAYFGSEDAHSGPLCEISEGLEPAIAEFSDMVAKASKGWNGRDPIRTVGAA